MKARQTFTPGPWRYEDCSIVSDAPAKWSGEPTTIVDLRGAMSGDDTEADARLIAASPKLYAKVAVAAEIFREYERLHLQKGTPDGDAKARRNAQYAEEMEAALAEVRGEQVSA